MRVGKVIKWTAVALVAAILVAAVVLYIQASRTPPEYHPTALAPAQRDVAAKEIIDRLLSEEFNGRIQRREPFSFTVTEAELNRYLASMDEIAWRADLPRGAPRGAASRMLDAAGMSDPAVAIGDETIAFMIRSTRHGKVLSAEMRFGISPEGSLQFEVKRFRVGRLTVPETFYRERLERLRKRLTAELAAGGGDEQRGGASPAAALLSADNLGAVAVAIFSAMAGEDVRPVIRWPIGPPRDVRIERIDIHAGRVALYLQPVPRDR